MIATFVAGSLLVLAAVFWLASRRRRRALRHAFRRRTGQQPQATTTRFSLPKPPWVHREVVRLKALMPDAGCRRLALTFNHLHEERRGMSVGKTYVAGVLRRAGEEVMRVRRKLRRRKPRRFAKNVLWGLDWTYVRGEDGRPTPVLGVVDCGSRACLELATVESMRAVALLRQLLELFERFGTPKVIRTDNEAACRSWLFRAVLRLVGVKHTRTAPFAPWQNGRIERLFGTVKRVLRLRAEAGGGTTVSAEELHLVRTDLGGRTPAEAWSGKPADRRRQPVWCSEWGGLLGGYWWPG
jgi:transposase InsO family protein